MGFIVSNFASKSLGVDSLPPCDVLFFRIFKAMLRLCKYYHNGSGRQDEWMLIMDGNGAGGGRRIGFIRRTRNRNMAYGEHGTAVIGNGNIALTNFRCWVNARVILT